MNSTVTASAIDWHAIDGFDDLTWPHPNGADSSGRRNTPGEQLRS
jgi:hypothetical protein